MLINLVIIAFRITSLLEFIFVFLFFFQIIFPQSNEKWVRYNKNDILLIIFKLHLL